MAIGGAAFITLGYTRLVPLSDQDKQLIAAQITSAFTHYLDQRTVAVIGMREGVPYEQGSGTCVEVGGRYFIATAAHVVRQYANADIWLIVTHGRQTTPPPIIGRGLRGGGERDPVDVAWLELGADTARAIPRHFVPLRQLRGDMGREIAGGAYVYGYPTSRTEKSPNLLSVQAVGFLTTPTWDEKGDPATDIFLEYPRENRTDVHGRRVSQPDEPVGMSGGSIWTLNVNAKGVWSPEDARLVGIEHAWREWRWVRGTQIHHWLSMLAEDLPGLHDCIRAATETSIA